MLYGDALEAESAHELHLTFLGHVPLTRAAVEFALDRHAGQRRSSDNAAFILHTLEVASLLDRSGYPDRVLAAAVLHDVIERADVEHSELEARFGREIAELVSAVSTDPAIEREEDQKGELRERVRRVGGEALAVYAADKISKVRELRMLQARGAPSEEIGVKLARHRRSLEMLDGAMPGSRLIEVLRFELEALEEFPPVASERVREVPN